MAESRVLPGLGLRAYHTPKSGGWNLTHDPDMRKLSALVHGAVLSRTTAIPGTPANGSMYIAPAGGANANQIVLRENGETVVYAPAPGMRLYVIDTGDFVFWDGMEWVAEAEATISDTLDLTDTPNAYGLAGQVLAVNFTRDALVWVDASGVPAGGTEGQVLARDAEGDAVWITPSSGGGGIEDAPSDGALYGRQDGAWVEVPEPPAAPDLSTSVTSAEVDQMVYLTQAAYDALGTKDARTLYLIPVA